MAVNDDELDRIVDFAWSIGATPRFIELMPLGEGAKLPQSARMSPADVTRVLGERVLHEAASGYRRTRSCEVFAGARRIGTSSGFHHANQQ